MQQGFTGVKNIAGLCGFTDPLYFSKIFKTHMGVSPTDFISNLQEKQ
jgi:AraC-like DNA-binding protein